MLLHASRTKLFVNPIFNASVTSPLEPSKTFPSIGQSTRTTRGQGEEPLGHLPWRRRTFTSRIPVVKQLQRALNRRLDPPWARPLPPARRYGLRVRCAMRARDWMPVTMAPVLIVDSYSDEAEMYAQYLRSVGAAVDYVRTPEEALSRFLPDPPIVVVTDMVFEWSAYDGPGVVRAGRMRPECALTNFIVLSGFTRPLDRERARAAGADQFLLKPCAPDELWRHVDSAVSAHDRSTRAVWNWPDDGVTDREQPRLRM